MFYGMDRAHWQKELRKAEAELEAARTLTAVGGGQKAAACEDRAEVARGRAGRATQATG
jgi:hypothetical protein